MLVLGFGLASATTEREPITKGRADVGEVGGETPFHYWILPRTTPVPHLDPIAATIATSCCHSIIKFASSEIFEAIACNY
ncbi:hypothetical protein ACJRO7_013490 [Eucalyptus globulus]|uniref:Secreted protein n=1 Tax=Eucalyptus globulus TaxID=34317 RepID=A0ABD3KX15_EUCGL